MSHRFQLKTYWVKQPDCLLLNLCIDSIS